MNKVIVLLSTYNGGKYLKTQLDSLVSQVGVNLEILVRDDGSTDETIRILDEYSNKGALSYYTGENLKPARSYLDLIKKADDADYYAFCDQDDFWLPDKLLKAIEKIQNSDKPSIYFSNTKLVNSELIEIKNSRRSEKVLSLGEAIVKNNATGCTIVFNRLLFSYLSSYEPQFISMHDHWTYLICLAINGFAYFDNDSYILYRQHENNVVGGKRKIFNEYLRKLRMLIKKDRTRHKIALDLYRGFYNQMPDDNKKIIKTIVEYLNSFSNLMRLLKNKDIHSDSLYNNILYHISVLTKSF